MKLTFLVIVLSASAFARPDGQHPSKTYIPAEKAAPTNAYLPVSEDVDEKHVYFYGSPNDHHYTKFQINVVPKSHKSTKVIFVKAPHHAGVIPEVVAPPSSSEHKTLVYVLVKKPIESQSVTIPAGLGVKQVKPDVFFIKYGDKKHAEQEIQGGLQGDHVGVAVPSLDNKDTFLGTLGNGNGSGYEAHGLSGPY